MAKSPKRKRTAAQAAAELGYEQSQRDAGAHVKLQWNAKAAPDVAMVRRLERRFDLKGAALVRKAMQMMDARKN
jgi:hypothetical protein